MSIRTPLPEEPSSEMTDVLDAMSEDAEQPQEADADQTSTASTAADERAAPSPDDRDTGDEAPAAEQEPDREAEVERLRRQLWSVQGNQQQALKRAKDLEERLKAKETDDEKRFQQFIATVEDPQEKATYQREWAIQQRDQALAQKEAAFNELAQQAQQQLNFQQEQQTREQVQPMLTQFLDQQKEALDLPEDEARWMSDAIKSPLIQQLVSRAPSKEAALYGLEWAGTTLEAMLTARNTELTRANRRAARQGQRVEGSGSAGGVQRDLRKFHGTGDTAGMLNAMSGITDAE